MHRSILFAMGIAGVLVATACSSTGVESPGTPAGDGVPYGATMAEYQAAFEDIDPISLRVQTPTAQGSILGLKEEAYYAAIEEWSGGKISLDIGYAYAYAPPAEVPQALADGVLDIAIVSPALDSARFPTFDALGYVFPRALTGIATHPLHANGFLNELALSTPSFTEEFEDNGLHLLVPVVASGQSALFCAEESQDFGGALVAPSNSASAFQQEALGFATTSLPFTESYEAIQRGVVQCTGYGLTASVSAGLLEVAPNFFVPQEANFSSGGGTMAMGKDAWNALPLVAQQLLADRADVYWKVTIDGIWDAAAEVKELSESNGGGVHALSSENEALLGEASEELLEMVSAQNFEDPEGFVARAQELAEEWRTIIVTDLGVDPDVDYSTIGAWVQTNGDASQDGFLAELWERSLLPLRP